MLCSAVLVFPLINFYPNNREREKSVNLKVRISEIVQGYLYTRPEKQL
jgi:hypothetical protein